MGDTHSDALVFFGATGDLAYKEIFPSLQAMAKRAQVRLGEPRTAPVRQSWPRTRDRAAVTEAS